MVLPKAIEKFRFHCVYEKNLSLKTMHAYDADLNQFLEKFKNYKINKISKFDLKDYVESLKLKAKNLKIEIEIGDIIDYKEKSPLEEVYKKLFNI